jgi:hypothetical protein
MFHRFGDLSTSSRSGNWVFADEDVPFSSQLTQRLHNRLSSLATLIDHTRRVMRGTEVDLAIREAYEEQVLCDFEESPSAGILTASGTTCCATVHAASSVAADRSSWHDRPRGRERVEQLTSGRFCR